MTGSCRGMCKGDRASWEPPTIVIKGHPACPCCEQFLTRSTAEEVGRPPNLNPAIADNTIRFEDDVCGYDVVYVRELVAR